jgi:hypothetical protein
MLHLQVPARMRNLIYAFDRSFEMALAALAAPLVGWIAEHYFGFKVRPCSHARGLDVCLLLVRLTPMPLMWGELSLLVQRWAVGLRSDDWNCQQGPEVRQHGVPVYLKQRCMKVARA